MRILTAEQFTKEPYGTVYIKYVPHMYIEQPKIKTEPRGEKFGQSWWAIDVLPWIKGDSDVEVDNELKEWDQWHDYELPTEGFCTDDAIYNHDDKILYAIFSKEEVKNMIDRLIKSLYECEQYNK